MQHRTHRTVSESARMAGDRRATRPSVVAVRIADADLYDDAVATVTAVGAELAPSDASSVDFLLTDLGKGVDDPHAWPAHDRIACVMSASAPPEAFAPDVKDFIVLPDEVERLVDLLAGPGRRGTGRVVTVVGAVGGCGASVIAAVLACRGSLDRPTMLVESDPLGVGADIVVGLDHSAPLRLDDMSVGQGHIDVDALWDAVPREAGLGVLTRRRGSTPQGFGAGGPEVDGAVPTVHALRMAGDLVICDAGRAEVAERVLEAADHVVLVTRADLSGALAARTIVKRWAASEALTLVVRRSSGDRLQPTEIARVCELWDWEVLPESGRLRRLVADGALQGASVADRRSLPGAVLGMADRILDSEAVRC